MGRDDELAAIGSFLDRAPGFPGALLLEGEAGIGKTTLWRAGIDAAHDRGYVVLSCSPSAAETQLAYSALADLLDDAFDEAVEDLPDPQRRALAVALLRADPRSHPAESAAVAFGLLGALRRLARNGPLVLTIDDVQWLDSSTAYALTFAARRLRSDSVGLLLARRTDGSLEVPLELDRVVFGSAGFRRTPIGPLSVGALHRVLHARLGVSFPRPTLRRIAEASGGNPFYALEIGRKLHARDAPIEPGEPLPIPDNLRVLVQERIAALPPETREILALIATLSQPAVDLVERSGDGDVWPALRPAMAAHVLEIEGNSIRFSHPLLSAAAESDLDPGRRRRLHRRLADVVHDLEERARHLALAAEGPSAEAAAALEEAAVVAAGRGASAAAADLAELAAKLTPPDDTTGRGRRLVAAGEQFFMAGDLPRAEVLLAERAASMESGSARAAVLFKLSAVQGEDDASAGRATMDLALREPGLADDLRASILLLRSEERWLGLEPAAGAEDARAALEVGTRVGDPAILVPALVHVQLLDFMQGRGLDIPILESQMALERDDPDPAGYWTPTMVLGTSLLFLDRLDEARRVLLREYERGLVRSELEHARSAFYLVEVELRSGNWTAAARFALEALATVEQTGARTLVSRYLYCMALVDAHCGRIDDARAAVAAGLPNVPEPHESTRLRHRTVLGFIETSLQRYAEALEHIGSIADTLSERGVGEPGILLYEADELEARIELGQRRLAEARIEAVEARGRQLDRPRELAYAFRGRGMLAGAGGDLEAAADFMQRALDEHERLPDPFERARTLLELGRLRRRMKHKLAAREALGVAIGTFEELGAAVWLERARTEAARIGGRLPAGLTLTPTERRIAELVALGHSNKEVAAALFVTVKTVERNLTRVYEKLGVRSRSALARRTADWEGTE